MSTCGVCYLHVCMRSISQEERARRIERAKRKSFSTSKRFKNDISNKYARLRDISYHMCNTCGILLLM